MNTVKDAISRAVDRLADELEALSIKIHDQPELAYQEVQACAWLCEFLGKQGFKVEPGAGGVETAFRATIETGEGPTVAILCEYDALPGIGHACGHNVIATSGAGAGAALAAVRTQLPKGRIHVIGTPAEEGGGGKIKLINAGLFKDVDAAMMIHGFDRTLLHQDLLGIARATFEFTGKASHASADPWEGINALDACVQTYNAVAMLRQQVRPDCRIHGIITSGGAAANIIPEYASATFYVRAPRIDTMWDLYRRVVACAEGAAKAAGVSLKVTQHESVYEPMKSSRVLLDLFAANMTTVGLAEGDPIPDRKGSSDVGNVSQVVPTIQPMIGIAPEGMAIHTREFAEAAIQPLARRGMVAAAKTMALTTYDLLAHPAHVKAAKEEFSHT
ncbi:MAG TPA: M20 family metallopeptidase [Methylomirabilota bacterium]|jgi:amidohydrolase|nr:M20 family metallopeptidase [Methylomirabilota bacterium]